MPDQSVPDPESVHGPGGDRDPRLLGNVLPRFLDSLRPAESRRGPTPSATQVGGVFGRWAEVVGDVVAAHVTPLKIDGTVLVVQVDEPAWATQLKFLEEGLLERLAQVAGARLERLEIRVAGAAAKGRRGSRKSV